MKPAPFVYYSPQSLDEALTLLAQHGGDAKPLAGGQSLIPAMNFRLAAPAVLVDLNGLAELSHITATDGSLTIGAMTRHRALERSRDIARFSPLVAETMPFIAHPAIRTRGTIGGSLAHADPAAELPAVTVALDASFTARNAKGCRAIRAVDFFTGLFSTALGPGEILTEIHIPCLPARTGCAFEEIARRHGDFALAGAAAVVTLDEGGRCTSARVALLSVGDRPVLIDAISRTLVGRAPTAEALRAAADAAAREIDPPSDIHASSRYRRHLAGVMTRRALARAVQSLEAA